MLGIISILLSIYMRVYARVFVHVHICVDMCVCMSVCIYVCMHEGTLCKRMHKPSVMCTSSFLYCGVYCDAVKKIHYIYIQANIYKYYILYVNVDNRTSHLPKSPLNVVKSFYTYSIS